MTEIKVEKESDKFMCQSCGGNMVFDPKLGKLNCPFCGSSQEILNEKDEIKEYDIETAEENSSKDWGLETGVIKCDSCGAQTVLTSNSTAQFCAFCGSSHIVKREENSGIIPESLIPFKIPQKVAEESFKKWIKGRILAPRNLKTLHQTQKISGIYIPHWTYDCNTFSNYTGEAGTYYYVEETITVNENGNQVQKTQQVRKTSWTPVAGDYNGSFDDILINASTQVKENIINELSFDLSELCNYKPEYISGFLAEKYSIGVKEGFETAKITINSSIHRGVENKINADEVRIFNIDTNYFDIKYKHLLLPIWLSAYTYKNKTYSYMVNGQTGKVKGDAPLSFFKVSLIILVIIGIIAFLYARYH
jgi:predicted RNA-binding Zn-ribbon protein involved in translation (DUF1610 family)